MSMVWNTIQTLHTAFKRTQTGCRN